MPPLWQASKKAMLLGSPALSCGGHGNLVCFHATGVALIFDAAPMVWRVLAQSPDTPYVICELFNV
jgi:hypothetical protein